MSYVTVKEENSEKLHLTRSPNPRAWALLVGVISLGLGAAYYSVDYFLWKMAYISGAVFVGLTCMDDWEECIFDKTAKKVTIRRQSLIQKLFQTTSGQRLVVANLDDVVGVKVQEEEIKYGSNGYTVVLNFSAGYSLGVTETATLGDRSEHELVAKKICTFLNLQEKVFGAPVAETEAVTPEKESIDDNSSTTSNESFEQIDKDDLASEDSAKDEKKAQ